MYWRKAAVNGAYIGGVGALCVLLEQLLGGNVLLALLSYAVPFVGFSWFSIRLRDKELGGRITYGQTFRYALMLSFFGAIIVGAATTVVNVLHPEYLADATDEILKIFEKTASEKDVLAFKDVASRMSFPATFFMYSVASYTFFGMIIGLITSAMVRR
ncbi:MAG: DUF4199 domain-containing protein [Prevotellaceae bacterium]|jgi:hypothetical protein|nr:DUF4199 domain-containing protein [Prevotellaceae bacterium]